MPNQPFEIRYRGAVVAALIVALCISYWNLADSYPYYYSWDMDAITIQDCIIINSSDLPDQMVHPSSGMYILLTLAQNIGHQLGFVSACTFDDLQHSANPLLVVAELSNFSRMLCPLLVVSSIVMLWTSLVIALSIPFRLAVVLLIAIAALPAFQYQTLMIRSEMYSIFYWCGALLCLVISAKSPSGYRRILLAVAGGLLLGLAHTSKVQAIFHLALVFAGIKLANIGVTEDSTKSWPRIYLSISVFSSALYFLISYVAYFEEFPAGIVHYRERFSVTALWILTTMVFVTTPVLHFILNKRRIEISSEIFWLVTLPAFGYLLAYFGSYFMYAIAPGPSFRGMLRHHAAFSHAALTFKVVFLGDGGHLKAAEPQILQKLAFNPMLYGAVTALFSAFLIGGLMRFVKLSILQIAMGLIVFVLFASTILLYRVANHDRLWFDTLALTIAAMYIACLVRGSSGNIRSLLVSLSVFAVGLSVCGMLVSSTQLNSEMLSGYNLANWCTSKFLMHAYNRSQPAYSALMFERYRVNESDIIWKRAAVQAAGHDRIKQQIKSVLPDEPADLKRVGVVASGMALFCDDPGYRIQRCAPELLDCSSYYLSGSSSPLRILPRSDIGLFLGIESRDFEIAGVTGEVVNYTIELSNQEKTVVLHCFPISKEFVREKALFSGRVCIIQRTTIK